ncbi:MAG: hypothetical protein IAE86_12230 [Burkholderiaceae bacterium]|nr:hypothetical protein [Burkholderiaceae bacterium]
MSRTLKVLLLAAGGVAVALWTLAALGAGWLLQAGAGALDGGSSAAAMQAVTAWTERPWVRHWLDPDEAAVLLDAVDWLLGLGGGPQAWLGTALLVLGTALVMVWAGGLVLALLAAVLVLALLRRLAAWWRGGARWPWRSREAQAGPLAGASPGGAA